MKYQYLFLFGGIAATFALLGYLAKVQVFPIAKTAIVILLTLILAIALCSIFVRELSEVLDWQLSATKFASYRVCFFAAFGLAAAFLI